MALARGDTLARELFPKERPPPVKPQRSPESSSTGCTSSPKSLFTCSPLASTRKSYLGADNSEDRSPWPQRLHEEVASTTMSEESLFSSATAGEVSPMSKAFARIVENGVFDDGAGTAGSGNSEDDDDKLRQAELQENELALRKAAMQVVLGIGIGAKGGTNCSGGSDSAGAAEERSASKVSSLCSFGAIGPKHQSPVPSNLRDDPPSLEPQPPGGGRVMGPPGSVQTKQLAPLRTPPEGPKVWAGPMLPHTPCRLTAPEGVELPPPGPDNPPLRVALVSYCFEVPNLDAKIPVKKRPFW